MHYKDIMVGTESLNKVSELSWKNAVLCNNWNKNIVNISNK